VKSETKESQVDREDKVDQINGVQKEIEELEALLAKKRAQKSDLDTELEAIDQQIDVVRSKYSDKIDKFHT